MADCWSEEDYIKILSFVEKSLWLFVQKNATTHKTNQEQVICNLAQISKQELRFLQIIHFLLSESIQKTLEQAIPHILRNLAQSTDRAIAESKGAIRGNIDWHLTYKRRMIQGLNNSSIFITKISIKTYNVPEVQALKYLLTQINCLCLEILRNIEIPENIVPSEENHKWKEKIIYLKRLADNFLKNKCLHDVELPAKINNLMLQKLRCNKNVNFKLIYDSLWFYNQLLVQEDKKLLHSRISQLVLKPLNRDILYEVYILLVTMSVFEKLGWQLEQLQLIGYNQGTIIKYCYDSSINIKVYYQTLPKIFAENSLYKNLMARHKLRSSLRRPDIILEINNQITNFKLLEVKRTQNKEYMAESIYKVLGYLKDFENCFGFNMTPNAVMIVWDGIGENTNNINEDTIAITNNRNYPQLLEFLLQK